MSGTGEVQSHPVVSAPVSFWPIGRPTLTNTIIINTIEIRWPQKYNKLYASRPRKQILLRLRVKRTRPLKYPNENKWNCGQCASSTRNLIHFLFFPRQKSFDYRFLKPENNDGLLKKKKIENRKQNEKKKNCTTRCVRNDRFVLNNYLPVYSFLLVFFTWLVGLASCSPTTIKKRYDYISIKKNKKTYE